MRRTMSGQMCAVELCRLGLGCVVIVLGLAISGRADEGAESAPAASVNTVSGRELFTREWIPGDKRSHGGDGLGPLFNESSCVACHNLGGVGGGGPAGKNAQIVTAFQNVVQQQRTHSVQRTLPEVMFRSVFGDLAPNTVQQKPQRQPESTTPRQPASASAVPTQQTAAEAEENRKHLAELHPGFQNSLSVVLHRNATYAEYESWRQRFSAFQMGRASIPLVAIDVKLFPGLPGERTTLSHGHVDASAPRNAMLLPQQLQQEAQLAGQSRLHGQTMQHGKFALVRSERNTTALFGDGAIEAIPDAALEALEQAQAKQREVSGRVSRLKDGKAGRFGWKAQTASLEDFVLTACAVELGLNVPGHPQAGIPHQLNYRSPGEDLNAEECRALVHFVRELPAPRQRPLADETDAAYVSGGQKLFESIGCAACHVPNVEKAAGIYSDLLLHDLGPALGDSGGSYGIFVPDSTPEGTPAPIPSLADARSQNGPAIATLVGATRQEWRTPPLWGVRDSGPYLHDGRADTLEQAVAFHAGEADKSTMRFFQLSPEQRFQVLTFLKSLVAPDAVAIASGK